MDQIVIPYKPRSYSLTHLHDRKERNIVLVWHRRAGKTVAIANHLIRDALTEHNSKYAYIAPFYSMAKNIAWDIFKFYSSVIPGVKINESELSIEYPTGSKIRLYGSDRPDALRGMSLHGVVFDEYAMQRSNVYSEIILPALTDHKGYAIWIGTPLGMNSFYELYQKSLNTPDWYGSVLTVEDTDIIDKLELARAKEQMTEDEFNQEFMCSFHASVKGAYYGTELSRVRASNRIQNYKIDLSVPVSTAWDIGVGDYTAIWFFQEYPNAILLMDYYQSDGKGVDHYIDYLKSKPYKYATHFGPHDLEVQEFGTGLTRLETARKLGFNFKIVALASIDDGINAVRQIFSKLHFHTQTNDGINLLAQYQKEWDDKNHCFKDRPLHNFASHCADALRYLAMARRQVQPQTSKLNYAWQKPQEKSDLNDLFQVKHQTPSFTPRYGRR